MRLGVLDPCDRSALCDHEALGRFQLSSRVGEPFAELGVAAFATPSPRLTQGGVNNLEGRLDGVPRNHRIVAEPEDLLERIAHTSVGDGVAEGTDQRVLLQ